MEMSNSAPFYCYTASPMLRQLGKLIKYNNKIQLKMKLHIISLKLQCKHIQLKQGHNQPVLH